jgi:hypothetical protein
MDVDEPSFIFVSRAYTEEDKAHYRKEGRCFCCNKQGHMARKCPFHKQQLGKPQKPKFMKKPYPTSYKKPTQQRFIKRAPQGYIPQARAASIEEINEDANDEEMEMNDDQGSYSEGYQDSYDQESYQESQMDDVPSLAAHTAKLNEGQRETWLEEMRQLGINF